MKVVFDARYAPDTGVGRYVTELQRALRQRRRFDYRFVQRDHGNTDDIVTLPVQPFSFAEQFVLPVVLRRERPDLFHSPHFLFPLLWRGRMIVTIHDLIPLDFPASASVQTRRLYPLIVRKACAQAARVIVPSAATRDSLIRRHLAKESQIVVTPYGVPTLPGPGNQAPDLDVPYALYLGLLRPHKNLPALLRALALLRRDTSFRLVVAGDGPSRADLERLAVDLGVKQRVVFLGHVSDARIADLYQGASVVVAPSFIEGFGFTVLEAMSFGIPVITSGIPAFKETTADAALEFDPSRPDELAVLLRRIFSDVDLRHDLAARGRQRASTFSWDRTAEQTERAYAAALL